MRLHNYIASEIHLHINILIYLTDIIGSCAANILPWLPKLFYLWISRLYFETEDLTLYYAAQNIAYLMAHRLMIVWLK